MWYDSSHFMTVLVVPEAKWISDLLNRNIRILLDTLDALCPTSYR